MINRNFKVDKNLKKVIENTTKTDLKLINLKNIIDQVSIIRVKVNIIFIMENFSTTIIDKILPTFRDFERGIYDRNSIFYVKHIVVIFET